MSQAPITVTGNITHDPELTFTAGGVAKLTFGVAVNYYWNDASGERQERTSFFNAIAWKQLAEDAGNVLGKGMRVVVTGRLEQRSYEDKEGKNRSVVEIVVEDIGVSVRAISSVERKQANGNTSGKAAPAKTEKSAPKSAARPAQQRQATLVEDEEPF